MNKSSTRPNPAANRIPGNWQLRRFFKSCDLAVMLNCATGDKMTLKEFAPGEFRIRSHAKGNLYLVNLNGPAPTCSCPDQRERQRPGGCKHIACASALRDELKRRERPRMTYAEMLAMQEAWGI